MERWIQQCLFQVDIDTLVTQSHGLTYTQAWGRSLQCLVHQSITVEVL